LSVRLSVCHKSEFY